MATETTKLRFGVHAHPLLQSLQQRVDQLPKEALNFVAALMAARDLVPLPLCDLIYGMVAVRNGVEIGPVHQALAAAVALRGKSDSGAALVRDDKLTLIFACGVSKSADVALKFVIDLPALLHLKSVWQDGNMACTGQAGSSGATSTRQS